MTEMAYCPACREPVPFETKKRKRTTELDGQRYAYWTRQAVCANCGADATYAPYQEEAGLAFNEAVREQQGLVPLDWVRDVPKMYAIGKRPLSKLLGWGEHTYSQLMEGQAPSKEHSDEIRRLHERPDYYYSLLMGGEDVLSPRAFARSKRAVDDLMESSFPDAHRIYELGYSFIELAKGDITNRAIQKLVYYTQGFSFPLLGQFIFNQMPRAWAGGPVYGQLWREYKYDCDDLLEHDDQEPYSSPFTAKEDELIQAVHRAFGCYSGDTLAAMTHREAPWIAARQRAGAAPGERCDESIRPEDMKAFFSNIAKQHEMNDLNDIGAYAKAAFENLKE